MRVRSRVFAITLMTAAAFAGSQTVRVVAQGSAAPKFEVDRLWPKPLPNHWILGSVTGLAVDAQDHIWIVHRGLDSLTQRTEAGLATNPPGSEDCCAPAPHVLEFDAAGALVGHWGGPGQGFEWPVSPGGIEVDAKGSVWITAAGPPDVPFVPPAPEGAPARGGGGGRTGGGNRGGGAAAPPRPADAHILKFSRTGQFQLQIGKAGQTGDKNSETSLDRPVDVAVDTAANEVYVADGGAAQRIVVFDATTGAHKRHWGGNGTDFARISAVALSKDGMVYVGDRRNNRIQVFKKDGTFVKEGFVSKTTGFAGSVWGIGLASDAQQRHLLVADGQDNRIFVVDRTTLAEVSSFGGGGGWPGSFRLVTAVGMDSKGNLYTAETFEGKRVQKFIRK
jgi:DNA-binding beta-propeller fold protein YncE